MAYLKARIFLSAALLKRKKFVKIEDDEDHLWKLLATPSFPFVDQILYNKFWWFVTQIPKYLDNRSRKPFFIPDSQKSWQIEKEIVTRLWIQPVKNDDLSDSMVWRLVSSLPRFSSSSVLPMIFCISVPRRLKISHSASSWWNRHLII